jgi:hypothetical protein
MQHRWRASEAIQGGKMYGLLHKISPYLFSKKRHVEIIEQIRQPGKMDKNALRKLLIEFKTLSHKGYKTKDWENRVQKFIELTQQNKMGYAQ